MKREDLRKIVNPAVRDRGQLEAHYTWFVTDDELNEIGFVRKDDVAYLVSHMAQEVEIAKADIDEMVRRIVVAVDNCFEPAIGEMKDGDALLDDIEREVRLAIRGEGGYA